MIRHPLAGLFSSRTKDAPQVISPSDGIILNALAGGRTSDVLTVDTAYARVGWYRRCVDARADALSQMPFTIRVKRSGRVLYDSEARRALPEALSYASNFRTLLKQSGVSAVNKGRSYWQETEGDDGIFYQWLAPQYMEEVYSKGDGKIIQYKRTILNRQTGIQRTVTIPAASIVAFYEEDPAVEIGPPVNILGESCRVNSDILYSIDRWLDGHMDRGLMPGNIISLPSNTHPDERSRFSQIWGKVFRGKDRGGNQLVVNADTVTVQKIGEGLSEFGQSSVVQDAREAIASTIGIPISYLLPNAANRATSFQDDENFYTKTVIPEGKKKQDALNSRIFGPRGLVFRFEFKRIPALMRSNLEQARSISPLVGKDRQILTVNEARDMLDKEDMGPEFDELNEPPAPSPMMGAGGEIEEQEPLDAKAMLEIQRWKGKVERKADSLVSWEPEAIPLWAYKAIQTRLDFGETAEEAFQRPYWNLG